MTIGAQIDRDLEAIRRRHALRWVGGKIIQRFAGINPCRALALSSSMMAGQDVGCLDDEQRAFSRFLLTAADPPCFLVRDGLEEFFIIAELFPDVVGEVVLCFYGSLGRHAFR